MIIAPRRIAAIGRRLPPDMTRASSPISASLALAAARCGAAGRRSAGRAPLRPLLRRVPRPERRGHRQAEPIGPRPLRDQTQQRGIGPSLRGVGALAADFYLRTGYMPLAAPASSRAAAACCS